MLTETDEFFLLDQLQHQLLDFWVLSIPGLQEDDRGIIERDQSSSDVLLEEVHLVLGVILDHLFNFFGHAVPRVKCNFIKDPVSPRDIGHFHELDDLLTTLGVIFATLGEHGFGDLGIGHTLVLLELELAEVLMVGHDLERAVGHGHLV